jgi:hypothetical protein
LATTANPARYSINKPWKQWSPHVGFAYQFGSKTVVRGGFGLFWVSPAVVFGLSPSSDFINNFATPLVTSVDGDRTQDGLRREAQKATQFLGGWGLAREGDGDWHACPQVSD